MHLPTSTDTSRLRQREVPVRPRLLPFRLTRPDKNPQPTIAEIQPDLTYDRSQVRYALGLSKNKAKKVCRRHLPVVLWDQHPYISEIQRYRGSDILEYARKLIAQGGAA
jgi:hypothetical protein